MILSATWRIGMWGLIGGMVLGGLYSMLILFSPGLLLLGGLIGGVVGGVVGILNGILVGVITRMYFNPLTNSKRYRWTIGIASVLFTGMTALIGFIMFFEGLTGFGKIWLTCWFDILPTIIAAATAGYASQRYARWYTGDKHKPKKKKREPSPF